MTTVTFDQTNNTTTIFDEFYNINLVVNASEYDAVYSYFYGITNSKTTASNFTVMVFKIAQEGGYSVMNLLETLQGTTNALQMNKTISFYMNTFRPKTTMYGVSNIPIPNPSVMRNVVI